MAKGRQEIPETLDDENAHQEEMLSCVPRPQTRGERAMDFLAEALGQCLFMSSVVAYSVPIFFL